MTTKIDTTTADVLALTRSVGTPGLGASENDTPGSPEAPAAEPDDASAEVLALVRKAGLASFAPAADEEG